MSIQKPREIAFRILHRFDRNQNLYLEDLLEDEFSRNQISPPDRRLAQELAYGIVRAQSALDWLIARKTTGRTQKPQLQILLRLGLYQIFFLQRIPDHAAVHETVEMAKHLGFGPQAGFINAVLRGYLREKPAAESLLQDLQNRDPATALSHPAWLFETWRQRWGAANTLELLRWNNSPPPTFARINTLLASPAQVLEQWRQEDVEYDFVSKDWFPDNTLFLLKSHPSLATLKSFQSGWFYIQDPSTLLAVHRLNPQPRDAILDLCAAPGGKTTYIAQLLQNQGRIIAQDQHPQRLQLVRDNCSRLGVTCVETTPAANASLAFDRILVDAPCSNTGVMRRRVELRWRLKPEALPELSLTQSKLLTRAAQQLKPGGALVYSTCSLEPEENSEVVRRFLAEFPTFRLEEERELKPFVERVDGAYVAVLIKPRVMQ